MLIKAKKLIGLSVKTKSGRMLGKIYDFEIDSDRGEIIKYLVCDSLLTKNLLQKELVIDKSQVIEINESEMIVDDNIQRLRSSEFASI